MSTIQVDRIIPFSSSSVTIEGNVVQADAATTGSNTFVGDQNIVGTITASIAEGFALVGGVGSVSTLVATSSFGGALPSGVVSGSTQITALGFATTGSNTFIGNQIITGSLLISGGLDRDLVVEGRVAITGPTTGQTPTLFISSSDGNMSIGRGTINVQGAGLPFAPSIGLTGPTHTALMGQRIFQITKPGFNFPNFQANYSAASSSFLSNFTENLSQTASYTVGVFDNDFTQDVELQLETTIGSGIRFMDIDSVSGLYIEFLKIAPNAGTNPPLQFKRSAEVTGSVNISQVLKLGAIDPLPANGVGQLAVSGSNLFYNDGSTWTQIN